MICPYGDQEKFKGGLISFFLNGLFLEGKSMSLLKFFLLFRCVFEAIIRCVFDADGGPIMDV
jgi:hypothetical protein